MKKLSLLLILLTTIVQAQIVNIPDANFKNALISQGVDTNNDGEIQVSEAEARLILTVNNYNISTLEGIQSFINLETLHCSNNQLTELDISQISNLKSLACNINALTNLDVSQNLVLEELYCEENLLTSLTIHSPNLINLNCRGNLLISLDVSQSPLLYWMNCGYNQLTSLDVSQNVNMEWFYCGENQLTSLDITQNTVLTWFNCAINQITSLDVSQNPMLSRFHCFDNQLTNLDVSQNPNLFDFACGINQLTNLDVTQNPILGRLFCEENQLTSLNIKNGNNIDMTTMRAPNNPNLFCITVDNVAYANSQNCDDNNWCVDDWAEYSENCVFGISEIAKLNIRMYPNPVQNKLYIRTNTPIDKLQIYTLQGQLIQETKNNQIDVSLLSSGLYFASIMIDGKSSVKKFIKK